MSLTLRPYQIRMLDQIWAAMQIKLNLLVVAPCAAGKTVLFSKITQRLLRENSTFRVLILVDREILATQSRDKLHSIVPELSGDVGMVCSSVTTTKEFDKRVTIASRQTLINHFGAFPPMQLCIVDEAHLMSVPHREKPKRDQFGEIIEKLREYNPNMRMIGCTASPYRLGTGYIYGNQNKAGSMPYFDAIDAEITTKEMLAEQFLAPLVGRVKTSDTMIDDISGIKVIGGEYNLSQLSDLMCRPVHVQSCVDAWTQFASDRKKTLIFCTTIEHSETVAAAFQAQNIPALAIHSKLTPLEETSRMRELECGKTKVFTSVAKLTTGMDVPDLDCGILARPTKSTALYKQMIGRFQRLAEGKTDALILDLVGATQEFGTDMDNLKVNVPRVEGEAPYKICPGNNQDGTVCGQSVHASLKYCPHCSFEFPVTKEVEAAIGTMKKVEFNKLPPAEEYSVSDVIYSIHQSKNSGKHLIKVTYACGYYSSFSEYLCLPDFYSGFAIEKSRDWWERSTINEPFPQSVEEFMFLQDTIAKPTIIKVVRDRKFDRVVEHIYSTIESENDIAKVTEQPALISDDVPF